MGYIGSKKMVVCRKDRLGLKGGHFPVQICPVDVLKFIFKVGTATEKVYSDNKQT